MILKFSGIIEYDFDLDESLSVLRIGGEDVIRSVSSAFEGGSRVYVAMADEAFDGDLYSDEGSPGYSEWTPGDPAELRIGNHDVLDRLERLRGANVTLWIADEPVNTLEDSGRA